MKCLILLILFIALCNEAVSAGSATASFTITGDAVRNAQVNTTEDDSQTRRVPEILRVGGEFVRLVTGKKQII